MRDHFRIPPRALRAAAFAGVLLLLAIAPRAMALRPVVLDGADLFKPDTIEKADAVIQQIKKASGKDLMVEAYPTIPDAMRPDLGRKGKERFYFDWMVQRANALKVDGVIILITQEPGRLQIGIGAGVSGHLFTQRDRQELQ